MLLKSAEGVILARGRGARRNTVTSLDAPLVSVAFDQLPHVTLQHGAATRIGRCGGWISALMPNLQLSCGNGDVITKSATEWHR